MSIVISQGWFNFFFSIDRLHLLGKFKVLFASLLHDSHSVTLVTVELHYIIVCVLFVKTFAVFIHHNKYYCTYGCHSYCKIHTIHTT